MTPQIICDTVDMIGFGCELLGMTEISHEVRQNFKNDGQKQSDISLDSAKIRGEDELMSYDENYNDFTG